MNSIPPNAATAQWRVAWFSVLAAGFSFLSALLSIVSDTSLRGVMLPGIIIALAGVQVHLAFRQTRRTEAEQFRAWMPGLSGTLYALGVFCIGIGALS